MNIIIHNSHDTESIEFVKNLPEDHGYMILDWYSHDPIACRARRDLETMGIGISALPSVIVWIPQTPVSPRQVGVVTQPKDWNTVEQAIMKGQIDNIIEYTAPESVKIERFREAFLNCPEFTSDIIHKLELCRTSREIELLWNKLWTEKITNKKQENIIKDIAQSVDLILNIPEKITIPI